MADSSDLNLDAPSDLQDLPDLSMELIPPQEGTYPDRASLLAAVQAHGKAHGYNIVVKSSSTPTEKKPGRVAKVWLRCDRGGQYRPRNGLTEETRKRRRTSRLMDCPFMLVAAGHPGIWTLTVLNPSHNHGPIVEKPRQNPHPKAKKGQVTATPYDWPHDATFTPIHNCACGYMAYQGYDITPAQLLIPKLQRLLDAFRSAGFPVYHTREGHRSDLSSVSNRETFRSKINPSGIGIGSDGPLGRLLIRGEPGHDIIPELYPTMGEPIIDKPGKGAFTYTDFELLLRNKGIKNLVLAGVTTDGCVSTTMREAADRGFDCILLEDDGGIFGATTKVDDMVQAVENFKAVTVKKLAPQMSNVAQ
ncbi:hypothetical protein HCAG_07328 [Histoplasma mississippiense (nom. inval.)]|uniref:hypothetical protein n=1 Tax=Ajellomyces capsulatus (strain NAm1 / WU24) TaxID=2059318 RepID=UPI000157D0DB|nr:hypothetical protein HCAG_07328 [Histoplasma mississippiense (nom. inval.)]EDN10867.1 hypothetical protein HCAG_07328 [Histoplasma mississippiense (nom. inval.)]